MNLRNYQRECIDAVLRLKAEGKHRQLISMATAAGKTVVFSHLIKEVGGRAIIIAHTIELLKQAQKTLKMVAPELTVGLVNENYKDFNADVVIVSTQSAFLESNLKQLKAQNINIMIYDECHRAAAEGNRRIIEELGFGKGTNKLLVGCTATAYRSDKKGLGEVFDVVAFEKSAVDLINDGFLVPPKGYKVATDIDLSAVQTVDGDFHQSSLAAVMNTTEMNQLIVKSWLSIAKDRPTICFAVNVAHAKNIANMFVAHGVAASSIDGEMPQKDRDDVLEKYKAGEIKVLCNCSILTEGVDLPMTQCVITKPTKSKGLYTQMVGRGLRLWPDKDNCIVLDFGSKNHTICSTAVLFEDQINPPQQARNQNAERELPPKLNPQLKAAIVNSDPLGKSFTWQRGQDNSYIMRGGGIARIEIQQQSKDQYIVYYCEGLEYTELAYGVDFEWAFSTAEDYARDNRKKFALSDKDASWRNEPITEKQKALFKKCRFKAGIDKLTKGQATDIISSGILFNKKEENQ